MKNVAILALLAAMTAFGAVVVACGDAKAPTNDPGAAASSAAPAAPSAS